MLLFNEGFSSPITFLPLESLESIDLEATKGQWRLWREGGSGASIVQVESGRLRIDAPLGAAYVKNEVSIDLADLNEHTKLTFTEEFVLPPYRRGTWASDWVEHAFVGAYTKNGYYYEPRISINPKNPGETFTSVIRMHTEGSYQWNMKDIAEITMYEGHVYKLVLEVDAETDMYVSLSLTDLTTGVVWNPLTASDGMAINEHPVRLVGDTVTYPHRNNSIVVYTWLRCGNANYEVQTMYVDNITVNSALEPEMPKTNLIGPLIGIALLGGVLWGLSKDD